MSRWQKISQFVSEPRRRKRTADWLEKFSVASGIVGAFHWNDWSITVAGLVVSAVFFGISLLLTD
ncbi:hypothetical protein FACS1894139_08450 [Planctomycetales bacterium]|nr:hypothetical protein FACS1894107_15130 [Planctomycetales bacterium]GHS96639.1 hypothetical protein FACS1894108_01590 [Planctomycetales bacterium]GHT05137.1 hypothetical protein FACS1894139_08450 [Planctomycetales bacterium]